MGSKGPGKVIWALKVVRGVRRVLKVLEGSYGF